jgi:hypothetical protein
MTSLAAQGGIGVSMNTARRRLARHFASVLGCPLTLTALDTLKDLKTEP